MVRGWCRDYITKPFNAEELIARVGAVLRRNKSFGEIREALFQSHNLAIDFAHHTVMLDSQIINLTATEYRLLSYLAHNCNSVVTREQILEKVWGGEYLGEPHILQVNIARLRQKLRDDVKNPRYIVTKARYRIHDTKINIANIIQETYSQMPSKNQKTTLLLQLPRYIHSPTFNRAGKTRVISSSLLR